MNNEYVVTRLKAERTRFVSGGGIELIAGETDLKSVMLLLDQSVFREEMEKLKSRIGPELGAASLVRVFEQGRITVAQRAAEIVRFSMPEIFEPLFSRLELEQVKYALRCISSGEPLYEKRFGFVNLFGGKGWTDRWRSFHDAREFAGELRRAGHPFAPALAEEDPPGGTAEMEARLERYYFGPYLSPKKALLKEVWDCYARQNDVVNMHILSLLRRNPGMYPEPGRFFMEGPGAMDEDVFARLLGADDRRFVKSAEKILGLPLGQNAEASPFGLSIAVKKALLRHMAKRAVEEPVGLVNILLFLEELSAMVANLKLALFCSRMKAPKSEIRPFFIMGKTA